MTGYGIADEPAPPKTMFAYELNADVDASRRNFRKRLLADILLALTTTRFQAGADIASVASYVPTSDLIFSGCSGGELLYEPRRMHPRVWPQIKFSGRSNFFARADFLPMNKQNHRAFCARLSATTQTSSKSKLAAFKAVCPVGSYIGATSQMSAPTRRFPRRLLIIICASRTL